MHARGYVYPAAIALVAALSLAPAASAECPADPAATAAWLPQTPAPVYEKPISHKQGGGDCPFYTAAWQTFLFDTQADASGGPAFLSYPNISTLFDLIQDPGVPGTLDGKLVLAPRSVQFPNEASAQDAVALAERLAGTADPAKIDAGIEQAGLGGLLLDRDGFPVFYSIAVNSAFADFVGRNAITAETIASVPPDLQFTTGVVELKAAWKVITDPAMADSYIVAKGALVPTLKVENGELAFDGSFRSVDVALLALHVVFAMPGHPELVWSTFQHVSASGVPDLAPSALDNAPVPDGSPVSTDDFVLYPAATPAGQANRNLTTGDLAADFDPAQQRFVANGTPRSTPVYRVFPASKAVTAEPDKDIIDLNRFMLDAFAKSPAQANDKRRFYQLVGATWLDEPELTFQLNRGFKNAAGEDSDTGPVAGEDALSSVAMESFTQDTFKSCFSCHDTHRVTNLKSVELLKAKRLNVSHVLSKFLDNH